MKHQSRAIASDQTSTIQLRGQMREGLSRKEKQHKQRHGDRHVAYLGDFVFKHNTVLALQRQSLSSLSKSVQQGSQLWGTET